MTKDFSKSPASACRLAGGGVEVAESTDGGATIPIRMSARSPQPIEHWWWGRAVHDMAGMKLHKQVIPIDYEHGEPIGFLNQNTADAAAGVVCAGSLVPTEEPGDRVRRIASLSAKGVPYEASINFFGDGIVIEVLLEGQSAEVNGYTFEGPGVIFREWPLRGVAVCPYGADMHTESQFSQGDESIPLTVREHKPMSKNPKQLSAEEEKPAEETKPEGEQEKKELEEKPAGEEKPADAPAEASNLAAMRAEAKRFRQDFGDKGAVWFSEGLTHDEARARQTKELAENADKLAAENAELKKKLQLAQGESGPVSFDAPEEKKRRAGFAQKIRIVSGQKPAA